MCTGSFAGKCGKDWTDADVEEAFLENTRTTRLDELIRFAYGFTQNLDLAEQVVRRKLTEACVDYRHTYDPRRYRGNKCPFCNWLYHMIARAARRVADWTARRRAAERRREVEQPHPPQRSQPPPDPGPTSKQLWELAQPYLDRFSRRLQEVMDLCWNQGLTAAEAATQLGLSLETIRVHLCRARHKLWGFLGGFGGGGNTEEFGHEP